MSAMSLRRCCAGPPESAVPSRSVLPGVDDGGHVCAVSSVKSVHAIRPGTVYGAGHRGLLSPFSRTRWMMRVPWFDRLLVAAAAVACVVLVASPLPAQQGAVITGRVTSEQGDPLGGASVVIANTHFGAATTANGNYTITIAAERSEEHTSELQSRLHLVCRLLLEKKK